jgi:hypothetical protein
MEWDTIWPVIALLAGFVLNWAKDSVSASKAIAETKRERFDQLQRDTHLELQDVINEFWRTSTRLVNTWDEMADLAGAPQPVEHERATDDYRLTRQRARTLCSRLGNQAVRTTVDHAIEEASRYQAKHFDPTLPKTTTSDWFTANEAVETAVEKLGELVREPPSG